MFYPSLDICLGLSNPVKSRNPPQPPSERERQGQKITGYARRLVRSGVEILTNKHGKKNLSFLTLTIPSLPWFDMDAVRLNWDTICKRVVEELGRELARNGVSRQVVYVSEIQEERWKNKRELAPHLHLVFQGRRSGELTWAISKEKAREIWERIIGNVLCRPMTMPASSRIESIKKSAKRYLGKYMSKGGKVVQEVVEAGMRNMLPTSWWGMSFSLRKEVKEGIYEPDQELKDMIVAHWEDYRAAGIIKWGMIIKKEIQQSHGESIEIPVCFCGEFSSKAAMLSFIPTN